MDLVNVISNVIAEKPHSHCRLCLIEITDIFVRFEDVVCLDADTDYFLPISEVLKTVLGTQVSCDIAGIDALCMACIEMALNSYKFIKKFQEVTNALEAAFDDISEQLNIINLDDLSDDHTLYVVLNENETKLIILNKNSQKQDNKKHSKKFYTCKECGKKLKTLSDLKNHVAIHNNSLVCDKCFKTFTSDDKLEFHMNTKHRFKCPQCPQTRMTKDGLKEHQDKSHTMYMCKDCGKSYRGIEKLRVHEEGHRKKTCPKCGKMYNTKDFFLKHKNLCLQGLLEPHAPRPTSKFPFTCERCGKGYSTKGGLRVHNRFVHGNAKPHVCKWCSKAFTAPSYLKTHIIKHTGEKKFQCTICPRKFVSKEALLSHVRRHTGERPYSCKQCSERFVNASARAEHIKFKHIGPTLMCEICSRKFVTSCFLRKHMSKHHDPRSKLFNRQTAPPDEPSEENVRIKYEDMDL